MSLYYITSYENELVNHQHEIHILINNELEILFRYVLQRMR